MFHITASLVVVYIGFYLFVVFLSLSIACGLYYLAELIEEYTITTKRLLGYTVKAQLLLHLLLFIDRLPVLCIAAGVASHLAYWKVLRKFPYISVTSTDGLISSGCFLASLGLWVRHFWGSYYTVEYIGAFLLVTTLLVPFLLFLSMAGEQAVLPGAGGFPYTTSGSGSMLRAPSMGGAMDRAASTTAAGPKRRGLALRLFDILRRKRDTVIPEVAARMPSLHMQKEKV